MHWIRKAGLACASFAVRLARTAWRALGLYIETDGEQRAASFAYYAFFALFPLILLFVSIGSLFVDNHEVAGVVVHFVGGYMPMGDDVNNAVIKTINGVINSWKSSGAIAIIAIVWSALGLFHALVRGVNRAWGTLEYPWWRLPFKNLLMVAIVGSALMIGVVLPAITDAIASFLWRQGISFGVEASVRTARVLLPTIVLFYGFTMFYRFAPRRKTTFIEIWAAALVATVVLQVLRNLFVVYATHFSNFNRVYGTFGGVVALLMWIYLSGSVIIFGGCLSAAQAETKKPPAPPPGEAGKD